jgi:hypothetical protein
MLIIPAKLITSFVSFMYNFTDVIKVNISLSIKKELLHLNTKNRSSLYKRCLLFNYIPKIRRNVAYIWP